MKNIRSIYNNQLYLYTLLMNNLKIKVRKQFHLQQHKIKYLGINLSKNA